MKISIIIAIYNEAENLKLLYDKLKLLSGFEWEAIMVNDGSTDASKEILKELAEQDQRIKVINFRRNYGQTAALSAGFDHASGEVVIPMDGDLQNDPADIPKLLAKIEEGYDCVSGWRKDRHDKLVSRKIPSRIANFIISKITKVHLHDYGCSLKAYKKEILDDVKLYGEMHRFIPAYAVWHGASVAEVVVTHHPRIHGETKYGIDKTFRVVLDLITVKFLIDYMTRPMHFFGKAAFFSFLLAFISGALALFLRILGTQTLIETPLPLISAFAFMIAIQFLLMGLIGEVLTRIYYENLGKPIYNIRDTINFNK